MSDIEHKLKVLSEIAERLNQAGITWALGGSAMLYLNHISEEFHDLDLMMMEADADAAKNILLGMGTLLQSKPNEHYYSASFLEFVIMDTDVDVMAGFHIIKDGVDHDCSLAAEDISQEVMIHGQRIPLHSVEMWKNYYELMDRPAKVKLIEEKTYNFG